MWVKVCGNTRVEDALLAAESGADALGFIFAEGSRRFVTAAFVRDISDEVQRQFPAVERIGVFTTGDADDIVEAVSDAGLTAAQLHGDTAQAAAEHLRAAVPSLPLYAAFAWAGVEDFAQRARLALPGGLFHALLADAPQATMQGGTGKTFDWNDAARAFATARAQSIRVIAAGGLNAYNVSEVVRVLAPFGVDAASGTERSPGVKDAAKLRRFVAAARGAPLHAAAD